MSAKKEQEKEPEVEITIPTDEKQRKAILKSDDRADAVTRSVMTALAEKEVNPDRAQLFVEAEAVAVRIHEFSGSKGLAKKETLRLVYPTDGTPPKEKA